MARRIRAETNLRRRGTASPVIVALMAGILAALVVLIVVLTLGKGRGEGTEGSPGPPPAGSGATIADGQEVLRSELSRPPPSPRPVDDPDRVREMLRVGKTYRVLIKAAIDARVEDKAWGLRKVTNLAYLAEMAVDRVVESNDGRRVVEMRRFVSSRNVKLLCDVEGVKVELGLPGRLVLGALDALLPGTTATLAVATPVVEALLGRAAGATARAGAAKAVAHVDSLGGKAVRITYVDGLGVESFVPVGCTLDDAERDFVFGSAILSDCYILPDVKLAPGRSWTVDGSQLAGLLDPSLRGRASGEVILDRREDVSEGGKDYATLLIRGGSVELDSSDSSTRRIGSFSPTGTLRFCLTDGFVDRAALTGRFHLEQVSTDHILFETAFRSRPTLKVDYTCTIR